MRVDDVESASLHRGQLKLSGCGPRVVSTICSARGILSHRLLRRMWAPLGLTDSEFERLVQLLEQFEIALSLSDDSVEPRLLVPSFLREPLPEGAWPAG